ncbi:MAG: hypothetical protein IPK83_14320 [Planctomycetes bacterium]|nr:hypothetical protein [Planctomycetota bacterium]
MSQLTLLVVAVLFVGPSSLFFGVDRVHAAQAASTGDTCAELEHAAAAAKTPVERAHAHLNLARCRLVNECAAPLSAELCWTAKPDSTLKEIVTNGKMDLKVAKAAIEALPESTDDSIRGQLADRYDMLSSFAALFGALADFDDKTESSRSSLIDACVGVSTYLDDPNPGIAVSAKLWQGVAYRRAGRPDRTLQLLWPAIGEPAANRVDFFVRVERCRSLAYSGQFVAALSLAIKLDELVDECLKNESDDAIKRAEESLRWVRVVIYRRWAEHLRVEGKKERATSADAEAAKLLGEVKYPPAIDRWLRLEQAIVGLPDWTIESAATSKKASDEP